MVIAVFVVLVIVLIGAIRVISRTADPADDAHLVAAVTASGLVLDTRTDTGQEIAWNSVRRVDVVTRSSVWTRRTRFGFHVTIVPPDDDASPGPFLKVTGEAQTEALLRESHRLPGFDHDAVHNALRRAQRNSTTCFER